MARLRSRLSSVRRRPPRKRSTRPGLTCGEAAQVARRPGRRSSASGSSRRSPCSSSRWAMPTRRGTPASHSSGVLEEHGIGEPVTMFFVPEALEAWSRSGIGRARRAAPRRTGSGVGASWTGRGCSPRRRAAVGCCSPRAAISPERPTRSNGARRARAGRDAFAHARTHLVAGSSPGGSAAAGTRNASLETALGDLRAARGQPVGRPGASRARKGRPAPKHGRRADCFGAQDRRAGGDWAHEP